MDNLFNAEMARAKTIENKKTLTDILEVVEAMAKCGNSYATVDVKAYKPVVPDQLKELGYNVDVSENHISITW